MVENSSIWERFDKLGTEMIITKTGRRMFPVLKINIKGVDALYHKGFTKKAFFDKVSFFDKNLKKSILSEY